VTWDHRTMREPVCCCGACAPPLHLAAQPWSKRGGVRRGRLQLSHAAEAQARGIEAHIGRRLALAGMAGAALLFRSRPLLAQAAAAGATETSSNGVTRTTLESYENAAGEEFRLLLVTYPPGVAAPSHHHPAVAHNYILEGRAESRYADEGLRLLKAGDSYQDKAQVQHVLFRNPDPVAPLRWIMAYTAKKGQPFLIVP